MKKQLLPLIIASMTSCPVLALAQSSDYASHSGGMALMNNANSSRSQAKESRYISFSAGISNQSNSTEDYIDDAFEYKSGGIFNIAYGIKSYNWRIETELGYHVNDVDTYLGYSIDALNSRYGTTVDLSVVTFMANAYYDFETPGSVTPYVMGGIGIAEATQTWKESRNVFGYEGEWTASVFAWQVGAGIGIKASDKTTIDLQYRYLSPSDGDLGGAITSLSSSSFTAGARIQL